MFKTEDVLKIRNDDLYFKDRVEIMIEKFMKEENMPYEESVYSSLVLLSFMIQNSGELEEEMIETTTANLLDRYVRIIKNE